jgi:hypothetical protein
MSVPGKIGSWRALGFLGRDDIVLAGPDARLVTGVVLPVDGGYERAVVSRRTAAVIAGPARTTR